MNKFDVIWVIYKVYIQGQMPCSRKENGGDSPLVVRCFCSQYLLLISSLSCQICPQVIKCQHICADLVLFWYINVLSAVVCCWSPCSPTSMCFWCLLLQIQAFIAVPEHSAFSFWSEDSYSLAGLQQKARRVFFLLCYLGIHFLLTFPSLHFRSVFQVLEASWLNTYAQ